MSKVSQLLKNMKEALLKFDSIVLFHSIHTDNDNHLREFLSVFKDIEDSRMENKCTYSTMTIAGIVFLGLLHDMDTWVEIEDFAHQKKDILSKYVDLSCGIPSHDTLERVFSLLDSRSLEKAMVDFVQRCIETTADMLDVQDNRMEILAMDGKELKGSGRKYNTDEKIRNTQTMNFFNVSTGICIRSESIDSKTNEIPTAQKVLNELNIKDMIITSDAMNCQKDTVTVITKKHAHYVLGLKGNHGDFHMEIEEKFRKPLKCNQNSYFKMETEKNHNQVEIREFYKLNAKSFVYADEWNKIKSIVMYKKTITNNITGEEKEERRYYISDLNDIETIAESIRRHWAVENELHWYMDVSFNEDANRTINKKALNNLSIMKKNVLTIIKLLQPLFGNKSIKRTRKIFAMNYDVNLIRLFAFLDEKTLKEILNVK